MKFQFSFGGLTAGFVGIMIAYAAISFESPLFILGGIILIIGGMILQINFDKEVKHD